jgi:hypothetical protein
MTAMQELEQTIKKSKLRVGKYNVGLPGGESFNSKTPQWIKITGETFIFVGAGLGIVLATMSTPPGWAIAASSIAGLAGRYIAKCFSGGE